MGYLSIKKSLELVDGSNLTFNKGAIKVYSTNAGKKLIIKSSKLYKTGISYWYGIPPSILKIANQQKIDYFCFTIGYEGVIKLPYNILKEYIKNADVSDYKGSRKKHYHIRIKYDKEIILYNSTDTFKISKYLLYDENVILSDLQKTDIEKIREQAKEFTNYRKQYYLSEKKTKYRKESVAQKKRIAILEDHTCQICNFKCEYTDKEGKKGWIIEVDHITEKQDGGGETIDNLWVLCPNCHSKKSRGIIKIDKDNKKVYENGKIIKIKDNHLGWNK